MSSSLVARALSLPVVPKQKVLLIAIADASDQTGSCESKHLSTEVLARLIGDTPTTVTRALSSLQKAGYLRLHNTTGGLSCELTFAEGIALPPKKERVDSLSKEREEIAEMFTRLWDIYPNRNARKDAFKAFKALNPDEETLCKIFESVTYLKTTESWTKNGGCFIPLLATFLRGERWLDEGTELLAPTSSRRKEVSL